MLVFICEDMPEHSNRLHTLIENIGAAWQWKIEVHIFASGEALLLEIKRRIAEKDMLPDVIFSDIDLPGINGIELGKQLRELMPEVVLVLLTAFAEYAIRGYETGAYRYLLKPPQREDIEKILIALSEQKSEKKILVDAGDSERILSVKNIRYICAEDKYVMLYTTEGEFLDRRSLQYFEEFLGDVGFYRIHRKYMVNMRFHKALEGSYVILTTDDKIPVSRRKIASYRQCFMELLEGGKL